jgi:hypothetical protein
MLFAAGCGGGSPAHHGPGAARSATPPTTTTTAPPSTDTSRARPASQLAASSAPTGADCRMSRPRVVSAQRVGRSITVQWELSARPPASCGEAGLLITARSLRGDMAALGAKGVGGIQPVVQLSGTARIIDIVGPIVPPYEADISLFAQRGGRVEARARVDAADDPSPASVQRALARRDACRADAGMPTDCRMPPAPGSRRLTRVTASSLARAVGQSMAGRSADLAIQHVMCRPTWSCTVRFTLDYGKYPMRVTYRLGGTPQPGCWTLRGWSFTKAGPEGAGLPRRASGASHVDDDDRRHRAARP